MKKQWDVIIIGGGLAGYVAANYLAESNLSILLLEKGKKMGGRAVTTQMKGQLFNLGPHALYKKGEANSILEELGIHFHGKSPKTGGVLLDKNKDYLAPFNPMALLKSDFLNWKEKMEFVSLLRKIQRIDPEKYANWTFQQWVEKSVESKRCEKLLYTLGRLSTYCSGPDLVSAKIMLAQVKKTMSGVVYLDGGWQTIIDQLHNKAVISGVQVQSLANVIKIGLDEKALHKIFLSTGEEFSTKHLIFTIGPSEVIKLLDDRATPFQIYFLGQIKMVQGSTLDVALTKLPNPKKIFALGIHNSLYYSVHSDYAKLSDDGKSIVLHVFKYHQPHEDTDVKKVKSELEQFLEKLQPGWQDFLITSRFIPQITVNQRFPQVGDEEKLLKCQTEISGLYFAGDWASPDCLLFDGAAYSAKQAAQAIILKERRT